MNRVIISAGDYAFEALKDSVQRGETPILAESPFITPKTVKEWMYAAEALAVYNDSASNDLIEHALKLGLPIYRRAL